MAQTTRGYGLGLSPSLEWKEASATYLSQPDFLRHAFGLNMDCRNSNWNPLSLRPEIGKSRSTVWGGKSRANQLPPGKGLPVKTFARLQTEQSSYEAGTMIAAEKPILKVGKTGFNSSDNGSTAKVLPTNASIAAEAATHFKQFESVLQVLGGYERAVKAEVSKSDGAVSYENGTWPVLLGLARGGSMEGGGSAKSELKDVQALRATNDASWATERAEMEAKLESLSREVDKYEAFLRELQPEGLHATQTAGPRQGEEKAWWSPIQALMEPPTPTSSTPSLSHTKTPTSTSSTPHFPAFSRSPSPVQSREVERPPLLAAKQILTRRLFELRSQVAHIQGGQSAPQENPLTTIGLRARQSLRGSGQALGRLSDSLRVLGGRALPLVREGAREGRFVLGAAVLLVAAAAAGGGLQRAYWHYQEVQTVRAQEAAEEQLRQLQGTVVDLNVDNFVPVLTTRPTIVEFYTDWCPYCKQLTPIWEELAKRIADKGLDVQVARLNADVYSEPVMDLNLKGFPSLVLFHGTKPILNYTGPRDLDALLGVVEASYGQVLQPPASL